jgi:hypothetical protein
MISTKRLSGEMLHSDTPTWQPLINLAGDQVEHFMWMFEVELEDGLRLHAYKHWWTRRYIHLALDGRAFVYEHPEQDLESPGWYRQIDAYSQLQLVLPSGRQLDAYESFLEEAEERARQDSNLRPLPPEGSALSS